MRETIDSISEEVWEHLKEILEEKMLEFGVETEREQWTRSEVSNKLITLLENDYLIES
tara:strand:+ start:1310 stop:1483 length:174 start_codon:yes stop_codon:yes gene_type:complete